jgi:hypothetical protein
MLFFAIMNPFVWHYFFRSTKLECNSRFWEFFEGGGDYTAPWPDNPTWHSFSQIFLVAVNNLINHVKCVLPYNLILDLLSVTRVHMLIPMLSMSLSHTGGSGVPKCKRRFVPNEEGVLVDEVVIHQR